MLISKKEIDKYKLSSPDDDYEEKQEPSRQSKFNPKLYLTTNQDDMEGEVYRDEPVMDLEFRDRSQTIESVEDLKKTIHIYVTYENVIPALEELGYDDFLSMTFHKLGKDFIAENEEVSE
ncbi:hypothetical protein [Enterococcus alishanensis]